MVINADTRLKQLKRYAASVAALVFAAALLSFGCRTPDNRAGQRDFAKATPGFGSLSLDVAGPPFGSYDAAFLRVVQKRWFELLATAPPISFTGSVQLNLRLTSDGQVNVVNVVTNAPGLAVLIAQRALTDSAPFPKWPDDMGRLIGNRNRDMRLTFLYGRIQSNVPAQPTKAARNETADPRQH